ncbi:DUF4412 domain-containing protein [Neolewinella agarilytica]|uniref:DUF4412 domain-containing protein n=1 Tax=Neolewinella agarilytica TaxID=478744 RepID=UPI002357D22F|nr:DUF4412 domain-containing protein [Neolewinella agarilytica]
MKFRSFSTLLILFFCASMMAQTTAERAGERAKNRAENRANQRVDQKVDRAVDDAFNAVGNLFKKKKKKTGAGAESAEPTPTSNRTEGSTNSSSRRNEDGGGAEALGGLFGGGEAWEPYTNPVSFSMRMEILETRKNGKEQKHSIDMAITSNRLGMRMEDDSNREANRMILNTEDGKTTIITTDKNGEMSGMRMRVPGIRKAVADAAEDIHERFTFEQTGERMTIDGYNCEKVITTDTKDGTITEAWVTQDLNVDSQELFSSMMGLFGSSRQRNNGAANSFSGAYPGFPIKASTTKGNTTYETHYKNIRVGDSQVDRTILSTEGIPIQEIGF